MVYTLRNETTFEIKSSAAADESPLSGQTASRLGLSESLNIQGNLLTGTCISHMWQRYSSLMPSGKPFKRQGQWTLGGHGGFYGKDTKRPLQRSDSFCPLLLWKGKGNERKLNEVSVNLRWKQILKILQGIYFLIHLFSLSLHY